MPRLNKQDIRDEIKQAKNSISERIIHLLQIAAMYDTEFLISFITENEMKKMQKLWNLRLWQWQTLNMIFRPKD